MPSNTPKLGIPKPLGNENVNRANFNNIYDAIDAGAQKEIKKQATAPTTPSLDDLWIDTSVTPNMLKHYDGAGWVNVSQTIIDQNAISTAARADSAKALVVEVRTTDPASPAIGQMWFRSDL